MENARYIKTDENSGLLGLPEKKTETQRQLAQEEEQSSASRKVGGLVTAFLYHMLKCKTMQVYGQDT